VAPLRSKAQRLTGPAHRLIRLHIVNIRDGSPYYPPPSNAIKWETPPGFLIPSNYRIAMTGSRIMMFISNAPNGLEAQRVAVWDWKTGDLVSL